MKTVVLLSLCFVSSAAFAYPYAPPAPPTPPAPPRPTFQPYHSQPSSNYDYQTGNYESTVHTGGSSTTYGNNVNTGSTWSSHTDTAGMTRGNDSRGNSWSYNAKTGVYINQNTGEMCTGRGEYRICTGEE